jgi:hypothetical protein
MIAFFPSKHVSFNESIVGIGAVILKHLEGGKVIDDLWSEMRRIRASHDRLPEKVDFDTFILAVDFLFLVGAVKQNNSGIIVYASS